jgi:hypothetical protein
MRNKLAEKLLEDFKLEREVWAEERAKLLDRIQFPETRQVAPSEPVFHEPPKDEAELAHIGQVVPDFVQVGGDSNS